jgi:anti-sigma factor RsiW
MTCRDIESCVAAKADGSIDGDRERLLDAHLAECDHCRRALADQVRVHEALAATPTARPPADFTARVNARIDDSEGWLGLADFRAWTLRLAPVAAAVVLIAMLWRPATPAAAPAPPAAASATTFSPASIADWERDVSPNALLEAALRHVPGEADVR